MEAAAVSSEVRRQLGLTTAIALIVANMIGAGVFTTSGFALADLGSPRWVLLAWAVGGVLALCGALSYGALARRMPESGGEYYFLSRALHPLAGFLAGWVSMLAGFTAPIAVSALVLGSYLAPGNELRQKLIGTGTIAVAALMHGLRVRAGARAQNAIVGLKLALLIWLVGYGAVQLGGPGALDAAALDPGALDPARTASVPFDAGAFAVSLVWISFASSGWNAATYVGGELVNPERNLPRALALACLLVTALYLALNAVFVYSAPFADLAGRPDIAAAAAEALGGAWLTRLVQVVIALALFSSVCSMVMAGPRVYAMMAVDGVLPAFVAGRGQTPRLAVFLQAAAAALIAWNGELVDLLGYVGFTLGLSSAATVASLFVLRRREGAATLRVPGYPITPLVYLVGVLGASAFMVQREPGQALLGVLTVLAGLPVYWLMKRRAG